MGAELKSRELGQTGMFPYHHLAGVEVGAIEGLKTWNNLISQILVEFG